MNHLELSSKSRDFVKYLHERRFFDEFLNFCSVRFGERFCTDDVGLYEFSEFVQAVESIKPEGTAYALTTTVRRFCRTLESDGVKFKTSPENWKCPPKPDIDHFDPLSREEYQRLCSYLGETISIIKERLRLTQEAKNHRSLVIGNGEPFSSGDVSFFKYQVTLLDALAAFIKYFPDYPVDAEPEALQPEGRYFLNKKKVEYPSLDNEVKILRKRFSVQRIKAALPVLSDYPYFGIQDVLDVLLPNEEEAQAIRKAICLETGWSPDLVARINPKDFLFSEIDPNSDTVFLKTIKIKGTQRGAAYLEAKSIFCPVSKSKPDGAYKLIQLWLRRTESLRNTKTYFELVDQLGFEPFFVVAAHNNRNLAHASIRVLHPEAQVGRTNNAINPIYLKKLGFVFDERRLRPTHLYFRSKDQNIPFPLLVALFGHSNSAITDECYQSGSNFEQDRKDRLSKVLSEIEDSISDGSFAGELIPLKDKKTIQDRVYTVFADHTNQNPIAVCADPYNPSWPGSSKRVRPGQACKAFSKCLICTKSQVFSDNLPFVVDRYLYLEKKKRSLREDQFSAYLDEYKAAKNIVDSWPYQEDVEEAKERTFIEGYLLPPVIMGEVL